MLRNQARGFSLVSVIFLLVVLSGLAAYMATVSGVQHLSITQSVHGAQAQFAERSGLEWAIDDIVNSAASNLDCSPGSVSFSLTGGATAGFDVAVACTVSSVTEGSSVYSLYALTATATRGSIGNLDHAARTLVATIAF